MIRVAYLTCFALLIGGLTVSADHFHHNGHTKIKGKKDGQHQIHNSNNHVAHAHTKNGKVHQVSASHKGKNLKVNKYKTKKQQHALADTPNTRHFVMGQGETSSFVSTAANQAVTLFVGFGFFDIATGHLIIFWFPVSIVDGGDSGCMNYDNMMI
jgi:uncharacterized membrane protein